MQKTVASDKLFALVPELNIQQEFNHILHQGTFTLVHTHGSCMDLS